MNTHNYPKFLSLDIHRKGVVYIEDLKGVKLTSFSTQNSKEVSNALMVTLEKKVT
jgi:hypothetical protein